MRTFRIVGNSPACAYLSGRLQEAGYKVEWWTSGFFPQLRSVKLRSESFDSLIAYFKRSGADRAFLYQSPVVRAWASLRDGGDVVQLNAGRNEIGDDRFVDGGMLFHRLKAIALKRGVQIKEFAASFSSPLQNLPESTFLITDVGMSETRLWPNTAPRRPVIDENFLHTQSVWFPVVDYGSEMTQLRGISFAEWGGVQMILEPHAERGMVLTLCSPSAYLLKKSLSDVLNPKVPGLTEIRALFLLNNRQTGTDQLKVTAGKNPYDLPLALKLGNSVGNFHPMSNFQDDFALRGTEELILHCNRYQASEVCSQLVVASAWNEKVDRQFANEHRRNDFWRKLMFSKQWGRLVLKASCYLPKPLREKIQSPT